MAARASHQQAAAGDSGPLEASQQQQQQQQLDDARQQQVEQQQQQPQPEQPPHWFDALTETQRYVLADEWGFSLVGTSLPASHVPPHVMHRLLPPEALQHDAARALLGLAAPLALIAAAYAWLWYMHSVTPWWQLAACWVAIGTGYAGLFQLAHECARGALLPDSPRSQVSGVWE